MRKVIILFFLILLFYTVYANYSFGAGIYVGNPTGIRAKLNLNKYNSLHITVAYDIPNNNAYASLDYVYNFFYNIEGDYDIPFFIYTGPGMRILSTNNTRIGVKFNLGAAFRFKDIPVELFFELSPILDIYPATQFDMNAGIGFIFYFQ